MTTSNTIATSPRVLRLLLVEDDSADAMFFRALIERAHLAYDLHRVSTLAEALGSLTEPGAAFDVILLDLGLPDSTGLEGATRLTGAVPGIPIVVLTGSNDDELAMRAATQQVQDYLVKWDFDASTLGRCIRYAVERNTLREQLRSEVARAAAASQAKGDFLATMSHEIRAPMNVVLGMAELLRTTPLSPAQWGMLDRLRTAGDHLLALIDDVLDLSRIEAGRVELDAVPFGLPELVSGTADMVRLQAQSKGLGVSVDVDPSLPHVLVGDPKRLRQVLLNLLGNAVKFTMTGSVELTLRLAENGTRDGAVSIRVQDSGPGIPQDRLVSVFEKFVQADSGIARRHGGAGLGLAIASDLVSLMGGELAVESEVGRGSAFYFTVPLHVPDSTTSRPVPRLQDDETIERELSSGGATTRILLIDDSQDNHMLIRAYLEDLPVSVLCVESGEAGVAAFAADTFDVVFVDMHMPGLDGCATLQALRAHEQLTYAVPTPMIALSADVLKESLVRAKAAGCDDYVSKPVRRAAFLEVVWRFARSDGPSSSQALAAMPSEPLDPVFSSNLPRFLANRRADCVVMRASLGVDFDRIAVLAHNMKGTGTSFGFPELSRLGGELEALARTRDDEGTRRVLDELTFELATVDALHAAQPATLTFNA